MKKHYAYSFIALLCIYVILSLTLPTDPKVLAQYQLTQNAARLLNLSIILPLSIIYLSALYGFLGVNSYAQNIRRTKEGPAFRNIAMGLMVLAFGLPIQSIFGSISNYISYRHPDLLSMMTILRNYLVLAFSVASIILIAKGSHYLIKTLRNKKAATNLMYALVGPIALSSVFTWLVTTQTEISSDKGYHLPIWAIILTLAIPYTYIWCVGIYAVYQLRQYQQTVRGILYKRAFSDIAIGIGFIVAISIFIQFLTTLSAQINRLNLTPILGLIYLLVILYALGFGFVARGAKKLRQIEEA